MLGNSSSCQRWVTWDNRVNLFSTRVAQPWHRVPRAVLEALEGLKSRVDVALGAGVPGRIKKPRGCGTWGQGPVVALAELGEQDWTVGNSWT